MHHRTLLTVTYLETEALKLVLDYIDRNGKYQAKVSVNILHKEVVAHVKFVADADWRIDFPEPDFSISGSHGLSTRCHRNELLILIRIPGSYDGGIDYSLERLMKPAMDLLFDTPLFCYLRSVRKVYLSTVLSIYSPIVITTRWPKTFH